MKSDILSPEPALESLLEIYPSFHLVVTLELIFNNVIESRAILFYV